MEIVFILAVVLVLVLLIFNKKKQSSQKPDIRDTGTKPPDASPGQGPDHPVVIAPQVITGPAYVVDGDTIAINGQHIRLFGIDAPELNHPWGQKAKWELVRLCKGRTISVTCDGSSSYARLVGTCHLPDGTDLSAAMVKAGLALDWPRFSGGRYRAMEPEGVRRRLWRCHNRQIGRHVPD